MNFVLLALLLLAALISVRLWTAADVRRRSTQLVEAAAGAELPPAYFDTYEQPWLARWLARAGYRDPSALLTFLGATAGAVAIGLMAIFIMNRLDLVSKMVESLTVIPGGAGDALALAAKGGPYLVFLILGLAPTLIVRARRRDRVERIEQDLAPTLELLAMLAEAGLGFDSAIARVQESESERRPLSVEFRIYQRDLLSGIPRLEALRRLAARVEITSVTIFISALVQAEQVGASLAETLRNQADELRDRRKMRALLLAQALPVKLVFPLMTCFLPGIFYSTLGPVISQLVDVADSVINRR